MSDSYNYAFSASQLAFYPYAMQDVYIAAGAWPSDAVGVSDADWMTYIGEPPTGDTLGTDGTNPIWVLAPVPVPPVPAQVTRWQAMQIMAATPSAISPAPATLLDDVEGIVGATGGAMALAWVNQLYLYRNGPFVPALMTHVGFSSDQVDAMFIAAEQLPP
jgi:hypothetical protein